MSPHMTLDVFAIPLSYLLENRDEESVYTVQPTTSLHIISGSDGSLHKCHDR